MSTEGEEPEDPQPQRAEDVVRAGTEKAPAPDKEQASDLLAATLVLSARRTRVAVVRRFVAWGMVAVLVCSLAVWWRTRDTLPKVIRVATASPGSLYHRLGEALAPHLQRVTGHPVRLVTTRGSSENRKRLVASDVQLALMQADVAAAPRVSALVPLFPEFVHVVVRRGGGIEGVSALAGKHLAIGPEGSGTKLTAAMLLDHYGVLPAPGEGDGYFLDLGRDDSLDAAVVITGLMNPDLRGLLAGGAFKLLPVPHARALSVLHPHLTPATIPRGLYRAAVPVVPPADVETVATMTVLTARSDASRLLVEASLTALYENPLRAEIPVLLSRGEAAAWSKLPLHPAALGYFQPFRGIDLLANLMESLAALKELAFALGAGLYLLWLQWRRLKQREREALVRREKERLDVFFQETIRIERAQMTATDSASLREHLHEVTRIKLQALNELTHEDLRGDVIFSIFLQQCGDLSRKIQAKLLILSAGGR